MTTRWPENKNDWPGALAHAWRLGWPVGALMVIVGISLFLWTGRVSWMVGAMVTIWVAGSVVTLCRLRRHLKASQPGRRTMAAVVLLVFASAAPVSAIGTAAPAAAPVSALEMAVPAAAPVSAMEVNCVNVQNCNWIELGLLLSSCTACSFAAAFCPILISMAIYSGFQPHLVIAAILDCLGAIAMCFGCVAAAENCGDAEREENARVEIQRLKDILWEELGVDADTWEPPPTNEGPGL